MTIIDLKTLKTIEKVKVTGNNPAAILYDPYSIKFSTFNGRSSNSTVIDANTNKVIATIALIIGKPGILCYRLKRSIYVNIEDKKAQYANKYNHIKGGSSNLVNSSR